MNISDVIDGLEKCEPMKHRRRKTRHDEDALQKACVRWFDLQYPKLKLLLHHSPNEGLLPGSAREGAKRKEMGVRAGFPDLVLLHPGGCWYYLCIELKTATGRQSPSQKAFEKAVSMSGGCYEIVRSLDGFIRLIRGYLRNL